MVQCMIEVANLVMLASSAGARAGLVAISWTMGGGSMTRRSRSPKPQERAASGCCRMMRLYCVPVGNMGLRLGGELLSMLDMLMEACCGEVLACGSGW